MGFYDGVCSRTTEEIAEGPAPTRPRGTSQFFPFLHPHWDYSVFNGVSTRVAARDDISMFDLFSKCRPQRHQANRVDSVHPCVAHFGDYS